MREISVYADLMGVDEDAVKRLRLFFPLTSLVLALPREQFVEAMHACGVKNAAAKFAAVLEAAESIALTGTFGDDAVVFDADTVAREVPHGEGPHTCREQCP